MKDWKRFLGVAALATLASTSSARDITPPLNLEKEMNQNLSIVSSIFETGYAPRDWKARYANWNLATATDTQRAKVSAQTTVSAYQQILRELLGSTKDYHVSISFHSTESASLPLVIRSAEGKFFLGMIDRTKLTAEAFPFNEGDEVVTFAGQPIADVVNALKAEMLPNVDSTDQAIAELVLTRRRASRGMKVPQGAIVLGIKKQGSDAVSQFQLIWDYSPEKVARVDGSKKLAYFPKPALPKLPSYFDRPMVAQQYLADDEDEAPSPEVNKFGLGEKESYLPELGRVVWRNAADKYFNAYIYQDSDKRLIGVIRIPSYSPTTVTTTAAAAEFAQILKHFKDNTEALVIDQLNNPGGSVFYLYALASMLTDQPLYAPKHRMSILPSDVAEAQALIPQLEQVKTDEEAKKVLKATDLSGYPVNYSVSRFLLGFSQFIVDQWNQGKRMSDPYYLWGADKINPSPVVQYTKPVLILINELDFSGGDFFPTIMQDNHRAKIMGTRTAGAGGYVLSVNFPNIFGVESFSYTGSIAERIDQNPIENLGVTPDVPLALTAADFTESFAPFKNKVNEEVKKLFK